MKRQGNNDPDALVVAAKVARITVPNGITPVMMTTVGNKRTSNLNVGLPQDSINSHNMKCRVCLWPQDSSQCYH